MRLRAAGLVLALAAITFKAFLPPGFMFAEDRASIVLCSIDGATVTYDVISGEIGDQHAPASDGAGQHCPFAVASAAAFAPDLIELAAPREAAVFVAAATPRAERPHTSQIGPPLPARGPPLHA